MNTFHDPSYKKSCLIPWYYRPILWMFPTYVDLGSEYVSYYKVIFGTVFILKQEIPPWRKP